MSRHAGDRRIEQFADDFVILHRRGLNHAQIADKLGYANGKAVANLLCRARRKGLISPPLHGQGCTCGLRMVTR
jgi:hypothetical protein